MVPALATGTAGSPRLFRRGDRGILLRNPGCPRLLCVAAEDLAFSWIFWMFALFILACGTTHWFGILTIWYPDYWTEGGIKLVTAALSVATAIGTWVLMPRALAMPTPAQYRAVTSALGTEVAHRETVARALEA